MLDWAQSGSGRLTYESATRARTHTPHRGTSSLKWTKYGDGILPLWVADMDFRAPQCVIDALKVRMVALGLPYDRPTGSTILTDACVPYSNERPTRARAGAGGARGVRVLGPAGGGDAGGGQVPGADCALQG